MGRPVAVPRLPVEKAENSSETISAIWDAGDLGYWDLLLALRSRTAALDPGQVFILTARDPGIPENLPAWCRMTGHDLIEARHPDYWIRRRA